MLIKIGYDIAYEVSAPTPMLLMLYVHPERMKDLRGPGALVTEPAVEIENFTDNFGNRCAKIVAPPGIIGSIATRSSRTAGCRSRYCPTPCSIRCRNCRCDVLPFLLGSRYCEVSKLNEIAW